MWLFTQAGSIVGRSWLDAIGRHAGPNTALCQFCRDLPQRRTAGYQIGKHRMEVFSTLDRCGFVCWRKPFRTVAAKSDAASLQPETPPWS
jgi:hypothetical protein